MIKKFILGSCLLLVGCSKSNDQLKVVATAIPHAELLEFVKPDLKEKGIDLKVIVVDDYNVPNRAVAEKEADANFFQHLPFLHSQVEKFHYPLISFANIELEPMGVYSTTLQNINDIPENGVISLPNDPTNEARALILLDHSGVIKLDDVSNLQATVLNIIDNPKNLKFHEIDAAMLARTLPDVDAAVINTNFALQAGLNPEQALVREGSDSPYVNIVVIREGDENRADLQALKAAMTSEKMRQYILTHYKGAILPAFSKR